MFRRHEIRISRTRVERRTRRLALRGWLPECGQSEAVEIGEDCGLSEALRDWREPRQRFGGIRVVVDDSLLQYAVVPGLADVRTVADFRTAALLRCEALFGWDADRWVVSVATPPTTGPALVCAARRDDMSAWEEAWRQLQKGRPSIMPGAIDAIDRVRRHIPDDARVALLSCEGSVGLLVQGGAVEAVVQHRSSECANWDDESTTGWLAGQAALAETWQRAAATVVVDVRDWGSDCVVRERRLK